MKNKRIVITGPESTGKSVLCKLLAGRLSLPYADEYARYYLQMFGPQYDYALLLQLSRLHLEYQREQVPDTAPLGVFDTDLINYKIWCEVVFGTCHPEIISEMNKETEHVYLLCSPDLPWEPDLLRENENNRDMLFERHRSEIEKLGRAYEIITGTGDERFRQAEKALMTLLA